MEACFQIGKLKSKRDGVNNSGNDKRSDSGRKVYRWWVNLPTLKAWTCFYVVTAPILLNNSFCLLTWVGKKPSLGIGNLPDLNNVHKIMIKSSVKELLEVELRASANVGLSTRNKPNCLIKQAFTQI